MDLNEPQTNRKPVSEWVNRLDFTQRQLVVQMYVNGVSISAITRIYQVHHSSVRYHLKKAGAYIKGRHGDVDMRNIAKQNTGVALDFYNHKGEKFKVVHTYGRRLEDIGWPEHEKNFPMSYKDYVQREKDRNSILLRNGISDVKIKLPDPDHDSDAFWKRKRRSPSDIEEQRGKLKVSNTFSIRVEGSIPIEGFGSVQQNGRSDLQSKG